MMSNEHPKGFANCILKNLFINTRAKKIGTARQIFGTVLTILRHGTPNFRRVNVSVLNVMWHQC